MTTYNQEPVPEAVLKALEGRNALYVFWYDADAITRPAAWKDALKPFLQCERQPLRRAHTKTHWIWFASALALRQAGIEAYEDQGAPP